MYRFITAIALVTLILGCSGGPAGSDPQVPQPDVPDVPVAAVPLDPKGVWTGTTSHGRTLWGVVRSHGDYWFLYSAIGDPTTLGGALQGTSVVKGNTFSSIDTFDYSMDEGKILRAVLAGQFVERQTMSGTLTLTTGESMTFTLAYQPHLSEGTPDITQVAGTYLGTTTGSIRPPGVITVLPVPYDNFDVDATNGGSSAWTEWQSLVCSRFEGNIYVSPPFEGLGHVFAFRLRSNCTNYSSAIQYGIAWFDPTTNTLSLFSQSGFEARPAERMQAFVYRGVKS